MPPGLLIRAREPEDAAGLTRMFNLPGFRHGTARLPFESVEATTARLRGFRSGDPFLVAELSGEIVGSASLHLGQGRRRHAADLGMGVHDDHVREGIGSALLRALIDIADGWLDLKRLQLDVNIDNAPAIALYERFGFEREGIRRADVFRDGAYVDTFSMARLKPGFP